MANIWDGKAWGIDVSRYQATVNIQPGVIDFGIAKLGGSESGVFVDAKFSDHVQAIYDAGAVPLAYWFVDASYYTSRGYTLGGVTGQVNDKHPILQKIIEGLRAGNGWKAVKALFFDLETNGPGDVWNATYLEDLRNRIADLRKTGGFPNIPLGVYSRASFIDTQASVKTWLEQRPEIIIWTANYTSAMPPLHAPLAQVRKERLPVQKPLWFGDNSAKPKQYRRFWQYHGSSASTAVISCPEVLSGNSGPSALDLNVWEGSPAELRAEFGMTQTTPPPPVVPPTTGDADLTALAARVEKLESILAYHNLKGA